MLLVRLQKQLQLINYLNMKAKKIAISLIAILATLGMLSTILLPVLFSTQSTIS